MLFVLSALAAMWCCTFRSAIVSRLLFFSSFSEVVATSRCVHETLFAKPRTGPQNESFTLYSNDCIPHMFTSQEARNCLGGKWLSFVGDSHTRGLVLYFVQYLSETIESNQTFGSHWWGSASAAKKEPARLFEGLWRFSESWNHEAWTGKSITSDCFMSVPQEYLDRCASFRFLLSYCMLTTPEEAALLVSTLPGALDRFADVSFANVGAWGSQRSYNRSRVVEIMRSLRSGGLRYIWLENQAMNTASRDFALHASQVFSDVDVVRLERDKTVFTTKPFFAQVGGHARMDDHVSNRVNFLNMQRVLNRLCTRPMNTRRASATFPPTCSEDWNAQNYSYLYNWQYFCRPNISNFDV